MPGTCRLHIYLIKLQVKTVLEMCKNARAIKIQWLVLSPKTGPLVIAEKSSYGLHIGSQE
jgi:hypothetical protein